MLDWLEPLRRLRRAGLSSSTFRGLHSRIPTRGRLLASSRSGTTCCSRSTIGRACFPSRIARRSPGRTATSRRRSSSTASSQARGRPSAGESSSNRSHRSRARCGGGRGRGRPTGGVSRLTGAHLRPAPLIAGAASSRVAGRARRAPLLRLRGPTVARAARTEPGGTVLAAGLPGSLSDLRLLTVTHWGRRSRARGQLVVHRDSARQPRPSSEAARAEVPDPAHAPRRHVRPEACAPGRR